MSYLRIYFFASVLKNARQWRYQTSYCQGYRLNPTEINVLQLNKTWLKTLRKWRTDK